MGHGELKFCCCHTLNLFHDYRPLLYGDNDLPNDLNRTILELTLYFIMKQVVLGRILRTQLHNSCQLFLEKYLH